MDARNKNAFSDNLFLLRQSRGLRQVELAQHAGIPPSVLSRLEGGQAQPSAEQTLRLVTAIRATEDEKRELIAAASAARLTRYMASELRHWQRAEQAFGPTPESR